MLCVVQATRIIVLLLTISFFFFTFPFLSTNLVNCLIVHFYRNQSKQPLVFSIHCCPCNYFNNDTFLSVWRKPVCWKAHAWTRADDICCDFLWPNWTAILRNLTDWRERFIQSTVFVASCHRNAACSAGHWFQALKSPFIPVQALVPKPLNGSPVWGGFSATAAC